MPTLISRDPATGKTLREIPSTSPEALLQIFASAKEAHLQWANTSPKRRKQFLFNLRETLLDSSKNVAELISQENGKPYFEALSSEILPALDTLTFFGENSHRILRDKPIPMTFMKHRRSVINYWPLGTVAIIAPWNYPFFIPFAQITMALAAGNAVIFKPSEITPSVGLKIRELIDNSGFPTNLVQTVIGDGVLGAAIIEQKPAKVFFTGSVETGKKIMSAAAKHLIPVNLELGGKDPMIVLPDADLDFATSAALWGGFTNSGQVCASTERLIIHENILQPFVALLKEKASRLRQGPPTQNFADLGPITAEKQKLVYNHQLRQARKEGCEIITGGSYSADGHYLSPTLVTGKNIEALDLYNEESFGPIIAITSFKTTDEAIGKANQSRYGLTASIITKNLPLAEEMARRLEAGTVLINDVVYTAGLPETPWGGVKQSGIGRTHSALGLYEFVHIRHIHSPRFSFLNFKAAWWFPYGPYQLKMVENLLPLFRRQWFERLRALPHFIWNLAQFLKNEKRL